MKKKKIILLDLGGVVFQSTGISNQIINWKVITKLNSKYGYELNIGKDKFPDFLSEYNQLTNQTLTGIRFLESLFNTLQMNRELVELIRQKHNIIIVSDNYRENIEYISERYDFKSWAIKQIYSYDYNMVKSNPLFFARLSEELTEYDKKEMLFIDDSQNKIASAEKNGIKGILFQNNEQIKRELREYSPS